MFTYFDVIVSVVMIICTLTSYARGFVRDFLSLLVWIGAGLLTIFFFPYAADAFESVFRHSVVVSVVAVVLVYVIFLFLLSLLNNVLLSASRDVRGGGFDKSLGALFGLGKGFIIASLLHFSIAEISGEKEPNWLIGETYGLTKHGAAIINGMTDGLFEGESVVDIILDAEDDSANTEYDEEIIEYYEKDESVDPAL